MFARGSEIFILDHVPRRFAEDRRRRLPPFVAEHGFPARMARMQSSCQFAHSACTVAGISDFGCKPSLGHYQRYRAVRAAVVSGS
jgi:hypothetical protein